MNGHPRHPGTEELAEFRAGITDSVRGDQVAAHLAECPECASASERLGEVPALLASIPAPAIPADLEARITSALRAEAERRAAAPVNMTAGDAATPDPVPADPADSLNSADSAPPPNPAVPLSSAPQRRRPAPRRTPRRRAFTAPLGALVATAACLVLAFIGYQLSGTGHAGSSAASSSAASQHAGANGSAQGQGQGPGARRDSRPAMGPASPATFDVLVGTTNFRKATLQQQVRQQLSEVHSTGPGASPGTSSSAGPVKPSAGVTPATGGDRWVSPSKPLVGCVLRLTQDARPELVEQATYQSQSVYMIAMANRAWVVERGCTKTNPELLASVALPGR